MAGRPKTRAKREAHRLAVEQAEADGREPPPPPEETVWPPVNKRVKKKSKAQKEAELMDVWQSREEAVIALLANPELSLRDLKDQFELKVSVTTLGSYRRRLRRGEEPWLTGPNGGGVPSSRAARGAVHSRTVAAGLRKAGEKSKLPDPALNPEALQANPLRPQDVTPDDGLTDAEREFREEVNERPAPKEQVVDEAPVGRPREAMDDGMTPRNLRREAALQRRKMIEGLNLMAGKVGMDSMRILAEILSERKDKMKARDVAVIGAIAIDKFNATTAMLEDASGESGVPGASDWYHDQGGDKSLLDNKTRDAKKLKRILKLVNMNQVREAKDAEGDGGNEVEEDAG